MKVFWVLLTALFCANPSYAEDAQLSFSNGKKLSYLSAGLGSTIISDSSLSTQSIALSINYRKMFSNNKFSYSGQVNPIIQTNSLFGVNINAGVGYLIYGRPVEEMDVFDRGERVLHQRVERSSIVSFLDVSLSMLQIFGRTNTATYSGFTFSSQTYLNSLPLQFTLQVSSLTLSSRSLSVISGYAGYYWNL